MTSNDMNIKPEVNDDESRQLLDTRAVDNTIDSSSSSLTPIDSNIKNADPESWSTERDVLAPPVRTSPAPPLNLLAKPEMKPIFVPSPWPTYLTLPKQSYHNYVSACDINYTPQLALEQVFLILKSTEACVQQLNIHTDLRRIMWRKKLSELKTYNHGYITIAICGGTGSGKSSLINAVLDAQILPTSDSRACTSAVVEVRYHHHLFYSAEVEFVTYEELRADIKNTSEDIRSKLSPDGEGGYDLVFTTHEEAALERIRAAFPRFSRETCVSMSPDEIINSNPEMASLLGTKKKLEARTPSEIRGSIAAYMATDLGAQQSPHTPQLWPLVKKVQVFIKAAALESGARLVDLPGTGDVSEARNKVSKDYLREADYIWIVAPMKRAVDESAGNKLIDETLKTELRHNKYDHNHIAFVATNSDQVSEREVIETHGLNSDPNLLELQAEIISISEAVKKAESEGAQTRARRLEISELRERRSELKRQKKRILVRKRNEHMKKVLQQRFRTGVAELNANSHNSGTQTGTMDVPVFTCSSYDYTAINMEDDYEPICFNQVEDTEIPRLQNFCYDLALPAQRKPILRIFQELEKFLCRLREYAGTDGTHNFADKLTLAHQWESDVPSVTEQLSLLSVLSGSSEARSRQGSRRLDIPADEASKPTLDSVAEQVTALSAEKLSTRGFSYEARQVMETAIKDCVKHLKRELRGAVEDVLLKAAEEAISKAPATHDLFAPPVIHWATYRATLRRQGEFKRSLNEELVAPITRKLVQVWPSTFEKPLLTPVVNDVKVHFEQVLSRLKQSSPPALHAKCDRQCHFALQEAQGLVNDVESGLKKLLTQKQRLLSRSLVPAIKDALGPAYLEAIEIRGRGSTELQKNAFRGHVDALRGTMFTNSVTELLEELDSMAESIGLILRAALGEVACQVEVNLATLWQVPKLSKEEIERRKEFISEADNKLRQLRLWLDKIPAL